MSKPAPAQEIDEAFMAEALKLAEQAEQIGEVPVGAVIVCDGEVVGAGYNRKEVDACALHHAEILAIFEASKALKRWRLSGCTLYVTLEPCVLCAGAILASRVDRVVYGAMDPKAGAVHSLYKLLADPRLNHRPQVCTGVKAQEASTLLKSFFSRRRTEQKSAKGKG